MSDVEVGRFFIERHVFVNVQTFNEKFNSLCLMIEKLYAVVAGECEFDNLDAACNHEVLLSGHIYVSLLGEKLHDLLEGAKAKIRKDMKRPNFDYLSMRNPNYLKKLIDS